MAHFHTPRGPFVLLIAEDNDDDFAFMSLALNSASTTLDIRRVPDGQACMAYLDGDKPYSGMPSPDLLLLDIDMPRMNGFDVMARIAADERLRHLRVVVFSSSSEPEDARRMYLAGCSSYVIKPIDLGAFRHALHSIAHYWFSAVTVPIAKPIC
jgi:chemotaxis family two-component system response regulator Rcp1